MRIHICGDKITHYTVLLPCETNAIDLQNLGFEKLYF